MNEEKLNAKKEFDEGFRKGEEKTWDGIRKGIAFLLPWAVGISLMGVAPIIGVIYFVVWVFIYLYNENKKEKKNKYIRKEDL